MLRIDKKIGVQALDALLSHVVRFCFRHSFKFQDLVERIKVIFLRIATEELEKKAEKVTVSRLSLITGMQRRDVTKFKAGPAIVDTDKGLIPKVLGQWQTNRRFLTKEGHPKILELGAKSEFSELVRSVSQDLRPASVLFELERIGAVKKVPGGAQLQVESYVPKGDVITGLNIFRRDLEDFTVAVEENLFTNPKLPNHHLRAEYDKVRATAVEALKAWFLKEGHAFQVRVRNQIAEHDQDSNPDPNYEGDFVRVVFGTFSRTDRGDV